MTRAELIERLGEAIATEEGFYVTEVAAKGRGIAFPTLAQSNANPGNIRQWRNAKGKPYPQKRGYVDFSAWSAAHFPQATPPELGIKALDEGWRVLRRLLGQYVDGKYTGGKPPSLKQMFAVYAPAADKNDPDRYAKFVAGELNVSPTTPLDQLIQA